MSFGYGVGDVIAVSTLARTIWGRFRDASDQFKAIQTDVFGLHHVLDDIANNLSRLPVTDEQTNRLSELVQGCRSVLEDTEKLISKNETLGTESSGLGSKTHKAWKKLKWDSTTVNELRHRMVSSTTTLNAFNTSLASQVSRATNDKVDIIAQDTQNLRVNQDEQKRQEILQWLSPLDFAPQQSDLSGRRQKGTGSWLLESEIFQEWMSKEGKTLICQGMPGAGKTMLASLVIDHLQHLFGDGNVVTAYIYCDYRRQDEQTPINLIASVAKQLLHSQASIPESIQKMYQHHRNKGTRPSFEEVLEMTASSMTPLSGFYLIVDALDELGNVGHVRQTLIGRLGTLHDLHHFNLLTTSRYIPSLTLEFHQPLCLDIRASPEDIRRYVEGHISDLPHCVRNNMVMQEAIANAIVDAVKGMFLLAQLHMDSLRDKASSKMVKKALENLPKGSEALDLAYHGAIQRVEDQMEGFRLLAKQLLGWLTYSRRLMTVKEVQHALAIEPGTPDLEEDNLSDMSELVGFCAGLVIVDEETQIIRLVHYTTQDYFRRNGDRVLASAQQDIAISCLTYLLYDRFAEGWVVDKEEKGDYWSISRSVEGSISRSVEARERRYPFLAYAAHYWATHTRLCGQQDVRDLMMTFAKDDRRVSSASQVVMERDRRVRTWREILGHSGLNMSNSPLSAMHLLAYLGSEELISELLNHGFKADAEDSTYRTPLWWAASQGHYVVVKLLLSQSSVNVNQCGLGHSYGREILSETPLGIAAFLEHGRTVKLLIEHEDVDVNLPECFGYSPLSLAVRAGHSAVVELLLTRRDIDVNSINCHGETPLSLALNFGKEDILKRLLEQKKTQVNLRDGDGYTPLARAARHGDQGVLEMLLNRSDIEVNSKDKFGRTPLVEAVRYGRERAVKLLLSHSKINLNSKTGGGETVLHWAAYNGDASIVKLLISRTDIEVNSKDYEGKTPLARAIIDGQEAAVELLCSHPDVDLDPRDGKGRDMNDLVQENQEIWLRHDKEAQMKKMRAQARCREILRTAKEKRSGNTLRISEIVTS